MKILQNISLKKYNTFRINVTAKVFIEVKTIEELKKLLEYRVPYFILGGGSNMLLTKDINDTVLYINIIGSKVIKQNKSYAYVKANAGVEWHKFVHWTLWKNLGGLENLSLIPGTVGACPIQNIGAYGVEVKDSIHLVNAIEIKTGKEVVFRNYDCKFGYRTSIFKTSEKGKYVITSVVFKLTKTKHKLHYKYGAIQEELSKNGIKKPTIKEISKAIISIREKKLPDPKKLGNSGSFFKNPIINEADFLALHKKNADMPYYKVEKGYKIPAGWLIEQCGFKGKRFGDAGVHENQALVLVNYKKATGEDILNLAQNIQEKVWNNYGIEIEMEVNIY